MRRNQWVAFAALGTALGLAGGWAWFRVLDPLLAQGKVATGYMAKTVCSCLYVEGRGLAGCRADALLDHAQTLAGVRLAVDAEKKSVTARLFPLASDAALYEADYGCTLK